MVARLPLVLVNGIVSALRAGDTLDIYKIGSFTRDQADASGNQSVTGVGFKPGLVIFFATDQEAAGEMCIGFDDGSTHGVLYDYHQITANSYQANLNDSIYIQEGVGDNYKGEITSMDSDGFTFAWVKGGTPTGVMTIIYVAIR